MGNHIDLVQLHQWSIKMMNFMKSRSNLSLNRLCRNFVKIDQGYSRVDRGLTKLVYLDLILE